MAATQIVPQVIQGPYPSFPITATELNVVWQAADVSNGNFFFADTTGDIILVWNTDAVYSPPSGTQHHFTLSSTPDPQMRTGDITSYVIAGGVISAFDLSNTVGWIDGFGKVFLSADSSLILFAVITR